MNSEQWRAYTQDLLARVEGEDPAEVQGATPALLRGRVAAAGGALRTRPERDEWSVLELAGHLFDAEVYATARYRWVLAHHRPELPPFDQDLVATRLRHNEADAGSVLDAFEALRGANLELWRRTTPAERLRAGLHLEKGELTYETLFRELAGHDRFHLAQIDRTLAAVAT